jgi:hypothetical protein
MSRLRHLVLRATFPMKFPMPVRLSYSVKARRRDSRKIIRRIKKEYPFL